jgi:hypothetical protein
MAEEAATPDPVELTRSFYATMDRDWDFGSLAGCFASDAVWDLSDSHIGIYEGVAAIGDGVTSRMHRTSPNMCAAFLPSAS